MAQNQCAVCKTEFTTIDEVIRCPSCGVAHHARCWGQNNGCATYGCLQTADEAQPRRLVPCSRCQKPMREGLAFCPNCGAKQERPAAKLCVRCATPLEREMQYCPECGQKVELPVDPAIARAIASYNEGLNRRKPQSKAKPFVIAIIVILALAACTVAYFGIKESVEETRRTMYLELAAKFSDKVRDASKNVVEISDAIVRNWGNALTNYTSTEIAVDKVLQYYEDEIHLAKLDRQEIGELRASIQNIAIRDPELWEIESAINDLYNTYSDLYTLAVSPSGGYIGYWSQNNKLKEECKVKLETLEDLLEKAGGK